MSKKAKTIVLVVVLVLAAVAGGYLAVKNKGKVSWLGKPLTKDEIVTNYFSGAASGKDASGKELNNEERQKLWEQSVTELVKYTNTNPTDTDAFKKLAGAYYNLGKYNEAISAYQKAIALEPDVAINYTNIAHAYMAANQNDLAIQNYEKSISLDPTIVVNYINLAIALDQEGKKDEAKAILEQGLTANPDNEMIKKMLEEGK